jgi:hypothetical protein
MIKNTIRWIYASVTKHLDENRQGVALFFEGEEMVKTDLTEYVECILEGPHIKESNHNHYEADFTIRLLISVAAGLKNKYRIHEIGGIFLAALKDIKVVSFGKGPEDINKHIDCAQLTKSSVQFQNLGLIKSDNKLRQARMVAAYKLHFKIPC